jgi:ribA/ribD-fused uncharacterized protein
MTIDRFDGTEHEFLSNFHPSLVYYEGDIYPTVEHAYQAAKTTDFKQRDEIRTAPTPGRAKRLGQKVELRHDWDLAKLTVMHELLVQKFQDPELRKKLLDTGVQTLIEGTTGWCDNYWGHCSCPKCVAAGKRGHNHLGHLLMRVRSLIRTELEQGE